MKLRWVEVSEILWVDIHGHHQVRWPADDTYEAWSSYPGRISEFLGRADSLASAKALCQAHLDRILGEGAA